MKFKVGDRVKSEEFGEGTVIEINSGVGRDLILVKYDKENPRLHDGNNCSKNGLYKDNTCRYYFKNDTEIKKINQFTKSDLIDGDITTHKYGAKTIVCNNTNELHGINEKNYLHINNYRDDLTDKDGDTQFDIIKVERPIKYETVFERKEEILDEVEKEYLRQVIRPFRNKVRFIEKEDNGTITRIKVYFNYHFMFFPALDKDKKMYEGMQSNRAYSLKELGL